METKSLRLRICLLMLVISNFSFAATQSTNNEYPGRELYVDVKHITLEELQKKYDQVTIIDVRSSYEYNTLHINNSVNIPLAAANFKEKIKKIRTENPAKTIVTYCNGKTCMKSYKAVRKAQNAGVTNIVAFDAGIFDWAKSNADKASLLGVSPVDPTKLISKNVFKQKLLPPQKFIELARQSNGIIVDARDPLQRDGVSLFIGKEKRASLQDEQKINSVIQMAAANNVPMFIYDEAGKQVRWLMYRLEQHNLKQYYFMEGGTKKYFGEMRQSFISQK